MPLEIHMVHVSEDDPKQYLVLATFMVRTCLCIDPTHLATCPAWLFGRWRGAGPVLESPSASDLAGHKKENQPCEWIYLSFHPYPPQ